MKSSNKIFPKSLWTRSFTYWWIVSLLTVVLFDLLWMSQTTFRAFSYLPFWPILFLSATILTLPSLFSRKGIFNAMLLLVADLLFIANLMYCRTYFNAIPLNSYALAGNLTDFTASVTDSFRWYDIFLPLLTITAYVFYLLLPGKRGKKAASIPYICLVAVLAFLAYLSDLGVGGAQARIERMRENAYEASSVSTVYSIPGFLIYDYTKSSKKVSLEDLSEVKNWLVEQQKYSDFSKIDSIHARFSPKKNLIIILCESFESWPIGKKVEGKELTPTLNRLISDSSTLYVPNVLTQVGSGRSIDAQLLILAGIMPMINNVYAYEAVDDVYYTIPKAIKEKGGRSYLITCDKPYVWNQTRVAEAFGIDTLIQYSDFHNTEPVGGHKRLSDGGLMAQSVEKLKEGELWPEGERGFLLWVTYSGHNPFRLPEKLRKIELKEDYPEIIRNYMITANYTDNSIGILIDYLKNRTDWDDTMVVITGDHEGLASARKEASDNKNTVFLVDSGQHTPFIVVNSPVGGIVEKEVGQIDLYSTILDLMDLRDYKWKGMGFSVISPLHPGIAMGSLGNIEGDKDNVSDEMMTHLEKARDVSNQILQYNLLETIYGKE